MIINCNNILNLSNVFFKLASSNDDDDAFVLNLSEYDLKALDPDKLEEGKKEYRITVTPEELSQYLEKSMSDNNLSPVGVRIMEQVPDLKEFNKLLEKAISNKEEEKEKAKDLLSEELSDQEFQESLRKFLF
jgi:hypothetical protein